MVQKYSKLDKLSLDSRYFTSRWNDTIYVDMDGVIADYAGAYEKMYGIKLTPHADIPTSPHGFYRNLDIIEGAYDGVVALMRDYDVYFLSSPSWKNPSSYTDKRLWLEDHFGSMVDERLILTHNKSLLRGRYLIDDRTVHGVIAFDGEHIHFGSEQFPAWDTVVEYIMSSNVSNDNNEMFLRLSGV